MVRWMAITILVDLTWNDPLSTAATHKIRVACAERKSALSRLKCIDSILTRYLLSH